MHYTSKAVYEYISKKNSDPIVERKKCRLSGQDFPVYQSDLDFYDKISPKFEVSPEYAKQFLEENDDIAENFEYKDGKMKCKIPTPTLCPEERQRRRLAFRNERKLYKRICDFSWKEIISIYSPDKDFKVYDQSIWWSDKRNALEYWVDIDMKKSFAEQFRNILHKIPQLGQNTIGNENCPYVNYSWYSKNCYMAVIADYSENIYYGYENFKCTNCVDCSDLIECENCYQTVIWAKNYKVYYSYHIFNSNTIFNSSFCENCSYCIDCTNLVGKKYYIKNKQVSKEIFDKERNQRQENTIKAKILPSIHNLNNEWVISGDFIRNSKKTHFSYNITDWENVKYAFKIKDINNSHDWDYTWYGGSFNYELNSCGDTINNTLFSYNLWSWANNTLYSFLSSGIKNCFGCVWLRNKEYCIFNKQYTKEEYNQLVPNIIAQMMREGQRWEFFNPQLSPFGYNETIAMEYYPLSKEEALKLGYKRSDYEAPFPKVEKFVQWSKLRTASCKTIHEQKPELLEKLLNYAVVCEVSGRPFRIIKQEIDFYIKHDLPLPKKHPDIRHQERMDKRPWRTLYLRNCDKCGEEILSVYPSSRTRKAGEGTSIQQMDSSLRSEWQKIYCEKCYQKEIYW